MSLVIKLIGLQSYTCKQAYSSVYLQVTLVIEHFYSKVFVTRQVHLDAARHMHVDQRKSHLKDAMFNSNRIHEHKRYHTQRGGDFLCSSSCC
jgi:hypothetical protein